MNFKLSESAKEILVSAKLAAMRRRQVYCDVDHLAEALLKDFVASGCLRELCEHLDRLPKLPFDPPHAEFSRSIQEIIIPLAEGIASAELSETIVPYHLLQAILSDGSPLDSKMKQWMTVSFKEAQGTRSPRPVVSSASVNNSVGHEGNHPSDCLVPYETVSANGAVTRSGYLDRTLIALLTGSAMIVGPDGSGRSTLLKLVIEQLQIQDRPTQFSQYSIWKLSPMNLIAGTTYRGELEERLKSIAGILGAQSGTVVVVVEDVHLLVNDRDGTVDIASVLVPLMVSGKIRILGYCTQATLRERLEKHSTLFASLQLVRIEACQPAEATTLLGQFPDKIRCELGIEVPPSIVDEAIRLTSEYLPQIALPGAAAKLVKAAAARLVFETAMLSRFPERSHSAFWQGEERHLLSETNLPIVTKRHLLHTLSEQNGIPFEHLNKNSDERIAEFESAFQNHIFGQNQILEPLKRTLSVSMKGLSDPRRPRGKFFFMGPPGTGKTESARLLASFLMGQEQALLRFDMSEFQDRSSISTLIGSDKGLVGSHEGGRLTEPLRINPHRVILFDEIEKADPSIYNIFLQILDNGLICDKLGNGVSFRQAILIFTSNVGCDSGKSMEGLGRTELIEILKTRFSPEYLNRMDHILAFNPLDEHARKKVVVQQLCLLRDQLTRVHGVGLEWDDRVIEYGCLDHDKEPGARQVLRWIQGRVKPCIASVLLAQQEPDRTKATIRVSMNEVHEVQSSYC